MTRTSRIEQTLLFTTSFSWLPFWMHVMDSQMIATLMLGFVNNVLSLSMRCRLFINICTAFEVNLYNSWLLECFIILALYFFILSYASLLNSCISSFIQNIPLLNLDIQYYFMFVVIHGLTPAKNGFLKVVLQ